MPDMIADSSAVLIEDRVLAQHQAALALIRRRTQDPRVERVKWLDLAFGRGQILVNVERVIPEERRIKIDYLGCDISLAHARDTERRAKALFSSARVEICDLARFEKLLDDGEMFDFVTMTNTVHEISPEDLACTLAAALCRVTHDGCVFVYDMETLPDLELGAIPWTGAEVQAVVHSMLRSAGVPEEALPDVAVWPHKTCECWNLQVHRDHFDGIELAEYREHMVTTAAEAIRALLEEKLLATNTALDAVARYGAETAEEHNETLRFLHDYWAISRSLGLPMNAILANVRGKE